MLDPKDTCLVLIDAQERLVPAMHDRESLLKNLKILVQGAGVLGLPVLVTEQNPKGLGGTLPEIAQFLPPGKVITKRYFNCCDEPPFLEEMASLNRRNVLLAGVEAHVCVYQTAASLVEKGYRVQVVVDATDSRTTLNKDIGLERARAEGACMTSVETALFEMLKKAEGDQFKKVLGLVK